MKRNSRAVNNKVTNKSTEQDWWLKFIPLFALGLKLITALNIKGTDGKRLGGWLGADGENYLNGVNGLLTDGYFSSQPELSFWPAGYPILIWILCKFSLANIFLLVSLVQSIFYAFACYFFVSQLRESKLSKIAVFLAILLAFNPTLSLSSLVVGYESTIASCMLLIIGLILKSLGKHLKISLISSALLVGMLFSLSTFMQPRWILTTVVVAIFWALLLQNRKSQAVVLAIVIACMCIAPAILMQRNKESIGRSVVSTNLGATMKLGAGEATSGGYLHTGPDVPCEPASTSETVTDELLVKCVLVWYASNPEKAIALFINKGWYFWSPWSGPMANGTMARNPWLKINPIVWIAKRGQTASSLINGFPGKVVSSLWVITSVFLMFIGFIWLYSLNGFYRTASFLTFLPVVVSWLVSMGTIGDHRFRIPTMGLSLFLQAVGAFWVKQRIRNVQEPFSARLS